MDNDKIIIILLAVIVFLLIIGLFLINPFTSKEDCIIRMVSSDALNPGDQFTIFLTNINGTPIADAEVNITFINSSGVVTTKKVITDSSGNGAVSIDDLPIGGYNVISTVLENDNYHKNSTTNQISINEIQQTTTDQSSESNGLSDDGYSYYPEYGPAVDSAGITREYAIAHNWHYITMRIDGDDIGGYIPYDSQAGCYHT